MCSFFFYNTNITINRKRINLTSNNKNYKNVKNRRERMFNPYKKCYLSSYNSKINIIHLIITRFLLNFYNKNGFPQKLSKKDYVLNGIRVMNNFLLPSLENQSCKNFTWILMLGNEANITFIKSLLNFNNSFHFELLYQKDLKNYVKNITKDFNILITTRIDYDDRIYYDAVNDVRKSVNINKPIVLYGYNRGLKYYEIDDKYYELNVDFGNRGVMSVFISLIINLNKVNDTYTVYDLGNHVIIKQKLLKKYKSFGVNQLNYDPAIFDSGDPKYIWVRQKYSGYNDSRVFQKELMINDFNLKKFYGF